MKMAKSYYTCPQSWTLAQILSHMQGHKLRIIAVLQTENDSPLVGTVEQAHLSAIIADLQLDPTRITAEEIFSNLSTTAI